MKYILLSLFIIYSCSERKSLEQSIDKNQVIGLLPYNDFDKDKLDTIAKALTQFYGLEVKILNPIKPSQKAFINIKSPRYRADSLIRFQKENIENYQVDYIVGLTDFDISTSKKDSLGNILTPVYKYNDWGVMGLGYRPGKSCIISTFRLKTNDKTLFINRLKKVTIHEFGHNLGLPHCDNKSCVMTSANEKISTIDNEEMKLCSQCNTIIHPK